jgi:hypothetical protein
MERMDSQLKITITNLEVEGTYIANLNILSFNCNLPIW